MLILAEKTTVRSLATAIDKELKPFDVKTDSQTIVGGLVSRILLVKTIKS
jgi:hypothetical protein